VGRADDLRFAGDIDGGVQCKGDDAGQGMLNGGLRERRRLCSSHDRNCNISGQ
jgi:hypothetical protein